MAEKLTAQQLQAVTDRGGKLLVSAAAGSGKTKVLVDRLLSYLKDPADPANIDDFLIITYTKAAAAELRGKIASKLSQEIANDPRNKHLQKQLQRLYLAQISTVHSFCADILRENAFRVDIPVDFRVAEENESLEMQYSVIEQLLNDAYDSDTSDVYFYAFVDSQGFGRNDRQLPDLILKLYANAKCHMDPDGWLEECLQAFDISHLTDVSELSWTRYLIDDLFVFLDLHIAALRKCAETATGAEGMDKPVALFYQTIDSLQRLRDCQKWDEILMYSNVDFGTLRFPTKNVDTDMAAHMKAVREACKKGLAGKLRRFKDDTAQILQDISKTAAASRGMVQITRQFMLAYDKLKKRKRVLDFGDLEHKMLDLLLGKRRYGPTAVANEISVRYREVLVDEYQDSNQVQDAIFSAITNSRQNFFMVGDVKQSIYQFRLAEPGIFLNKYNRYVPADTAKPGQGRKVLLSKNFRSSAGVVDAVNDVFSVNMSVGVGGLDYGVDEMLYEGIPHCALGEPDVELYGIQVQESTYVEEADFIAQRIVELLDGNHMVRENDSLRPIQIQDIAILLRSPGSVGSYYVQALAERGIPCCTGTAENLMETEEIEVLRAMLQVIDNPLQDIPLLAVLTSKLFCFTADDLASFRSGCRNGNIYAALLLSEMDKAKKFVSLLEQLRNEAKYLNLSKLLKRVLSLSRIDCIYGSMPDGDLRTENLQSFCKIAADFESSGLKGLCRFLKHLDALEEKGLAGSGSERSSGSVTVMSIHKSKGLEFPVVFLPALSRSFNLRSASEQLLCDKDLGLGLNCVDTVKRIRYPSVGKRAITAKTISESVSEEMRILYVAMTRARDRLIMSYASESLTSDLEDIVLRMDYTDSVCFASEARCPGKWILRAALQRTEAGAFFKIAGRPNETVSGDHPWLIRVIDETGKSTVMSDGVCVQTETLPSSSIQRMEQFLGYRYAFAPSTHTPSKLTATQLKGRDKDVEAAENTQPPAFHRTFRKPSFVDSVSSGINRGTAMHKVMQYLNFGNCRDIAGVQAEINKLVADNHLTLEQVQLVNPAMIVEFFSTEIGSRLMTEKNILREFKFSVLEDASKYDPAVTDEKILFQGVVDCAIIEDDGIVVIDFKTDRVNEDTVQAVADGYRRQVTVYANALERIYGKPIKKKMLYFFELAQFVNM